MLLFTAFGTLLARQKSVCLLDVSVSSLSNRSLGKLGFCLLGTDALAVRRKNSAREATGRAVARGMLVSLPLAFVFGGLLYSAYASFERLVRNAVDVDLSTFGTTIIIFTIMLVAVAGILRRLLIDRKPSLP